MQRFLGIYLLLFSNLLLCAQAPVTREYQIKAVFLFNFSQFVNWPALSFASNDAPLVIAVLGENPFGSYLEETIAGEKVNRHPVVVNYYHHMEEVKSCHILFIADSETDNLEKDISDLKGRSILTISDIPDFLEKGGMIKFFTRRNNIRFEINLAVARQANLVLSSKLLRVAELFVPQKK